MSYELDFKGSAEFTAEKYGSSREDFSLAIDELSEQIKSMDSVAVLVIGRTGQDIEVSHLIANAKSDDVNQVDYRLRNATISLPEIESAHEFMTVARTILHVDVADMTNSDKPMVVLDIGNSEGEGHSLSFIEDLENNDD